MECGKFGERFETFIPDPPFWNGPAKNNVWPRLNRSRTGVGRFCSCLHKWPLLRPASVAQKNKPSTMLSSNVQSIDLPMDCMAWRFWMMSQSIGCSKPVLRSSATKQCTERTGLNNDDEAACACVLHTFPSKPTLLCSFFMCWTN